MESSHCVAGYCPLTQSMDSIKGVEREKDVQLEIKISSTSCM